MNILILAGGQDPSQKKEQYPLCLTEFDSIPLIQHVVSSCEVLKPNNLIVAFRDIDVRKYHLNNVVALLCPKVSIVNIYEQTQGAVCTALLAVGAIDNDEELLIVNGNELLEANFSEIINNFRQRKFDAGIVTFPAIHPRYSYVRLDDNGLVVEAAEKNPISTNATAGFYWFSHGKDFVRAAKNLIRKDARVQGNFYICPAYNELVLENLSIGVHQVESKVYHPLKTERQIEQFDTALGRDLNE
ncbi:glycosyltransferase family 2 protein [Amylibacter sp.]|nr:glycosyltransferase family 2 protein [Amylibacter sp.]